MEPFVGQIQLFPYAQGAPKGWMKCEGQTLNIQQYQALYSLLGVAFGGDAQKTFCLPDLRGRVALSQGINVAHTVRYQVGNKGGVESVKLTSQQLPVHNHTMQAVDAAGNSSNLTDHFPAVDINNPATKNPPEPPLLYAAPNNLVAIDPTTVTNQGGGSDHENRQSSTALTFCIAYLGIYPSRN